MVRGRTPKKIRTYPQMEVWRCWRGNISIPEGRTSSQSKIRFFQESRIQSRTSRRSRKNQENHSYGSRAFGCYPSRKQSAELECNIRSY